MSKTADLEPFCRLHVAVPQRRFELLQKSTPWCLPSSPNPSELVLETAQVSTQIQLVTDIRLLSVCASLVTATLPVVGGGGGLFTSTNPEVRRIVPKANGRTQVKLVYVVLEAQYQSALTQAVKNINSNRSSVCVEVVGYLLEELRDPSNYAAFTKDMEDANIFIGSLIFIEELADKVSCPNLCLKPICCRLTCL